LRDGGFVEEGGVEVVEAFELQPRDAAADEALDLAHGVDVLGRASRIGSAGPRGAALAVHEADLEGVARRRRHAQVLQPVARRRRVDDDVIPARAAAAVVAALGLEPDLASIVISSFSPAPRRRSTGRAGS
jgi:hypothetical protein